MELAGLESCVTPLDAPFCGYVGADTVRRSMLVLKRRLGRTPLPWRATAASPGFALGRHRAVEKSRKRPI